MGNVPRQITAILLLLTGWLTFTSGSSALPATTAINQLHHKSWMIADGAPADVWALAQGPDGYMWLGTGAGLFRFDGTEFERIVPANNVQFLSIDITAVFAAPDGDIWIGYSGGGLSRLHNGELTNYEVDNRKTHWMVLRFARSRDGTMWAATERGLMRFDGTEWHIIGEDWHFPAESANWVEAASDGSLWVGDGETIHVLEPGARVFQPTGLRTGRAAFAEGRGGRVWVLDSYHGLTSISLATRTVERPMADAPAPPQFSPNYIAVDEDDTVWGTDLTRGGLFRISDPASVAGGGAGLFLSAVENFQLEDGLTSNIAVPILVDQSDQLWVGTNMGIDRLSRQFFVTESSVPPTSRYGFRAVFSKDREFILDSTSIYRLRDNRQIEAIADMPGQLSCAMIDSKSNLWIGVRQGLWQLTADDRIVAVPLPQGLSNTRVNALAEERDGSLLAIIYREGVFRYSRDDWSRVLLPEETREAVPGGLFVTPDGSVWMSLRDGRLLLIDSHDQQLFDRSSGLDIGAVYGIHQVGGHLLAVGEFGVARLEGRQFNTLPPQKIPPARGITGLAVSPDGQVWLSTISGVVRVSASELIAAFEKPDFRPASELFTVHDGLPGVAQQSYSDTASISQDGRIWFTTNHGLAWHDLSFEIVAAAPVPVRLKSVIANGVPFAPTESMLLPDDTTQLSVSYQSLNLSSPERTQFRYRLGDDNQPWVDVDTARLIEFSNLGPGQYSVSIEATSEAGIWLGPTERLTFVIPPTFFQSKWFFLTVFLAGLGLAFSAYLMHLRLVADRIKTRMEGRLAERERIARELHDTLLQGFQGLLLRFQSVGDRLPEGSEGRRSLEAALERADDVLQDGRDRVSFLRGEEGPVDLANTLSDLAADILGNRLAWSINVTGNSSLIGSQIADDIAQIASEAMWNIIRHAQAGNVQISVNFQRSNVTISIADDGIGIPPETRKNWRRKGHYGLVGMRERAMKLGAKIQILDTKPKGTEIRLSMPL
ncbi:sensor histidine kinase [Gimibacter soli]|uniref:Histidine kinase n=1 Tax=Gimibacter soli TaxID=3024400 RepID=A0AAE9XU02_9PROT|nr:sensor histidine kinase [Gimibacter soli]WCL53418.1 histidine kinase [Gimibacter soli]